MKRLKQMIKSTRVTVAQYSHKRQKYILIRKWMKKQIFYYTTNALQKIPRESITFSTWNSSDLFAD